MRDFNRDNRGGHRGGRGFGSRGGGPRQMHHAVCSKCNQDCEVPFRPTGSKPVFCSNCFEKKGGRGGDDRFSSRRGPDNQMQFDVINQKLDHILDLIQSAHKSVEKKAAKPKDKKPAAKKPAKKKPTKK